MARLTRLLSLGAFLGLVCSGCGDGGGGGPDGSVPDGSEEQSFCGSLADYATRCGGDACTQALVSDCDSFVGIVNPDLTAGLGTCLETSQPLTDCLLGAIGSLSVRDSHRAFATAFCEGCVSIGAETCEAAFFDEESMDTGIASLLVLPLGDAVVERLTAECTSGFTCALEIQSCAQRVIVESGLPEQTAGCLIDSLLGGDGFTVSCPGSDGGAPMTDGGLPEVDGGEPPVDGGMSAVDGGAGGDGGMPTTGCTSAERSANEPNDSETDTTFLGNISDRASYPAGTLHAGAAGPADPDWFSYHVSDDLGGVVDPQASLFSPIGSALLCVYWDCDVVGTSGESVTCDLGSVAISAHGHLGCCGADVELAVDCPGSNDSGTVLLEVTRPDPWCVPYDLEWGDD